MQRWIVLVGLMGAGKSAVGRAVADRLRVRFLDADAEIERAAAMPVSEIFARDGEAFFRARESEVIGRLLSGHPGVLATGGGAWLSEANRRAIDAVATSVWLDADVDTLWSRVRRQRARATRPLLATADPRATLAELAADREPFYTLAQLRVRSGPGLSVGAVAERVIEAVRPLDRRRVAS